MAPRAKPQPPLIERVQAPGTAGVDPFTFHNVLLDNLTTELHDLKAIGYGQNAILRAHLEASGELLKVATASQAVLAEIRDELKAAREERAHRSNGHADKVPDLIDGEIESPEP